MRERVLASMPALSYHFGLSPGDVWALTLDEFGSYADALDELSRGYSRTEDQETLAAVVEQAKGNDRR